MAIAVAAMWVLLAYVTLAVAYRALFTAAYLLRGRLPAGPAPSGPRTRFAVVIPAHDEEGFIADVIGSVRAADYPQELVAIHVIADNCADGTADRVRALGERVEERRDPDARGKGQALAWMFERMDLGSVDAVAVFDADVIVGREFFRAMDRELARGARCLQAFNGISNPDASTVTRMLAVTYVMKNLLFFAGKNALGLSVLLSGTGMVFASDVVRRHGWRAMSIGEDLEQTFSLLEAGERIGFVADAAGFAQESTSLSQAYTQRQRWLTGRFALYGRAGRAILAGLRRRSLQELECGLELLSPTYATHMNLTLIALVAAVPLAPAWPSFLALAALALGYQVLEIGVALVIMRARPSFVLSLAFAPAFLALRAVVDVLAVFGRRRGHWARTQRAPRGEEDLAE